VLAWRLAGWRLALLLLWLAGLLKAEGAQRP